MRKKTFRVGFVDLATNKYVLKHVYFLSTYTQEIVLLFEKTERYLCLRRMLDEFWSVIKYLKITNLVVDGSSQTLLQEGKSRIDKASI